jgi:hypothetical protein
VLLDGDEVDDRAGHGRRAVADGFRLHAGVAESAVVHDREAPRCPRPSRDADGRRPPPVRQPAGAEPTPAPPRGASGHAAVRSTRPPPRRQRGGPPDAARRAGRCARARRQSSSTDPRHDPVLDHLPVAARGRPGPPRDRAGRRGAHRDRARRRDHRRPPRCSGRRRPRQQAGPPGDRVRLHRLVDDELRAVVAATRSWPPVTPMRRGATAASPP